MSNNKQNMKMRKSSKKKVQSQQVHSQNHRKEDHIVSTNSNGNKRKQKTILPQITATPQFAFTRRYITTAFVSGFVSIADLLNSYLVATTSTTLVPLARAVRLAKIRWLAPVTTQGTTVTLTVTPQGTDSNANSFTTLPETYSDSSASIDKPAYISLTPSLDTPLGSWHLSTAINLNILNMTCPPGTIMDIFIESLPNISGGLLGYSPTAVAAVAGQGYTKNILTTFVASGVNAIP